MAMAGRRGLQSVALAGRLAVRVRCLRALGAHPGVEEFFAISVERRISHPCVVAITESARSDLFGH